MSTHEENLREWAKGNYATEAATELLLRAFGGRFAKPNAWTWPARTTPEGYEDSAWIDFDAILDNIGPLSSGEKGILKLAASIGSLKGEVSIKDALWSLDDSNARLAVTAIARSAGPVGGRFLLEWPA